MSVSLEILRHHIDYTSWATQRLLDAAGQLTPEELDRDFSTADKSVLGTLVHVFAADRLWLHRVRAEDQGAFLSPGDHSLAVLRAQWPQVWDGWRDWLSHLPGPHSDLIIAYQDLKGRQHSSSAWMIVLHLVNHASHHRGQVSGFLRAMGRTPPPLDLIAFYRHLHLPAQA